MSIAISCFQRLPLGEPTTSNPSSRTQHCTGLILKIPAGKGGHIGNCVLFRYHPAGLRRKTRPPAPAGPAAWPSSLFPTVSSPLNRYSVPSRSSASDTMLNGNAPIPAPAAIVVNKGQKSHYRYQGDESRRDGHQQGPFQKAAQISSLSLLFQAVAQSPHRQQIAWVGGVCLHLFPQAADVHHQRGSHSPTSGPSQRRLAQGVCGDDVAPGIPQRFQKGELLGLSGRSERRPGGRFPCPSRSPYRLDGRPGAVPGRPAAAPRRSRSSSSWGRKGLVM